MRVSVRVALAIASILCVAIPFLAVTFPPITDLPQQLAQARLLPEALAHPGDPYRVQWLTPYLLSYLPLVAFWNLAPPLLAGRLTMIALGIVTVTALHVTAARRGRPAEAAVVAGIFFFSHPMYWGFLSFLTGIPVFLVWLGLCGRPARGARDAFIYLVCATLLYFAHALWFVAGLLWLGVWLGRVLLGRRFAWADLWPRVAGTVPVFVMAVLHLRSFHSHARIDMGGGWTTNPITRLARVTHAALGGLRGPTELIVLVAVAAWIAAGVWQIRRHRAPFDRELVGAAALLAILFLALPDAYMDTLALAQRWLPVACMLLILGLPAPPLTPLLRVVSTVGLAAVFCLATTAAWIHFEDDELTGFQAAMDALPDHPRVLGLDFLHASPTIDGRPFLQMYAYSQVLHGGTLNFSFAEHPAPLVRFDSSWKPPAQTFELDWGAEAVLPADVRGYDHVLMAADPELQTYMASFLDLVPVTTSGWWRLYRPRSNVSP